MSKESSQGRVHRLTIFDLWLRHFAGEDASVSTALWHTFASSPTDLAVKTSHRSDYRLVRFSLRELATSMIELDLSGTVSEVSENCDGEREIFRLV